MNILAGLLFIALLPFAAGAQAANDKGAPDVEIVKLEVSVKRAPNIEESPVPRADPASIEQRHTDFNVTGPPQDSVGLGSNGARTGSSAPRPGSTPTDTTTPHYDRTGRVSQGSDAYWPTDREDTKSPYVFYATLILKNTGAKAVKAVRWDYVLTDPATKKEIKRYNFNAKSLIKPGDSVTLKETVKPSGAERRAEIIRIDYADGSTWQRP